MGWSLLPNALRSFKIYCAPPTIISQVDLFLWQTVETYHARAVKALQKCDPVILSEIHIRIVGVQQFHCCWDTFCIKDLCSFQSYIGLDVLWAEALTMDSCCLLMLSSLVALLCWGPSVRALECLQSLLDFQHSLCFFSIQSPIARLTTLYGRLSTGLGPVNGVSAPFLASLSTYSLPKMPSCPSTHTSRTELCVASSSRHPRHFNYPTTLGEGYKW